MADTMIPNIDLEKLTYPDPNLKDHTLDQHEAVSKCSHGVYKSGVASLHDLGELETLPLELLSEILLELTLRDFLLFSQVNRRAARIVDSIPQWKTISKHGGAVVRGSLCTRFASYISLNSIHLAMCTARCVECGDYGGYIYLFTCARICFLCFTLDPKYCSLTIGEAAREFGVKQKLLSHLPTLKTIPGRYGPNEILRPKRFCLIDAESASRVGSSFHGSEEAMKKYVLEAAAQRDAAYASQMKAWRACGSHGRMPRSPPMVEHAQYNKNHPRRFQAVVRAPSMDLKGTSAFWGFHCVGCQKSTKEKPMHWRIKYDLAAFREHLQQCGQIVNDKHVKEWAVL